MLAKTAGVKHLVVLVNKMDDPTVEWDKGRLVPLISGMLQSFMVCSTLPKPLFHFISSFWEVYPC